MFKLQLLYTGGTIGGDFEETKDIPVNIVEKAFRETLIKKWPSFNDYLRERNIELSFDAKIHKFSENITPSDWPEIAKAVYNAIKNGADSVIILHGTDTMSYTSSVLSFMLQGINVPVILTGSNIPLNDEGTDAVTNIRDSFEVAQDRRFAGVFLVFSGIPNNPSDIHLGCRARKVRFNGNSFQSINSIKIGIVKRISFSSLFSNDALIDIVNEKLFSNVTAQNRKKDLVLLDSLEDKVSFFKVYPGFDPGQIRYAIDNGSKGIILELYNEGTGCVGVDCSLLDAFRNNDKKQIPVFVTSQHEGDVVMMNYKSSKRLRAAGIIPLRDMITEAAIPKLMWALKQNGNREAVVCRMLTPVAGEIDSNDEQG
jgi:L-asparaginase